MWGRFNCGLSTLNLPYIAMENNPEHSEEIFFKNLDHYLKIAHQGAIWRVNHVAKIKAKSCPLLYQYGIISKLNPEDTLESLVYGGYATVSVGYCGIYETTKYITGKNHWEGKGKIFANKLLDFINKKNEELGKKMNISVALYGTPSEVLTDKVARACLRDFGQVGDGTQRTYITNSYHVPVFEKINAFDKLSYEAEFSEKTLGGIANIAA